MPQVGQLQSCSGSVMLSRLSFPQTQNIPQTVDIEAVKALVLQKVEGLDCLCATVWKMVDCNPPLENKCSHVILWHENQWRAVVGQEIVPVFRTNARNELLLVHASAVDKTHALYKSLASLTAPEADMPTGQFKKVGLLDHQVVQDMCDAVSTLLWTHTSDAQRSTPRLSEDTATRARDTLRTLRIVGGCWDKMTQYGMFYIPGTFEPFWVKMSRLGIIYSPPVHFAHFGWKCTG